MLHPSDGHEGTGKPQGTLDNGKNVQGKRGKRSIASWMEQNRRVNCSPVPRPPRRSLQRFTALCQGTPNCQKSLPKSTSSSQHRSSDLQQPVRA